MTTDDPWFRPVDIKLGPDGALYVADFYEQRIDHSSHYAGRIDRTNGRVYRLRAARRRAGPIPGRHRAAAALRPLDALTARSWSRLLDHPNRWFRQEALRCSATARMRRSSRALVDGPGARSARSTALESLWALNLCGGLDEATAPGLLDHPDPYVRLWTVRLLCDDPPSRAELRRRVWPSWRRSEPYVAVRSQLASSARRLPAGQALPIVCGACSATTRTRPIPTSRCCSGGRSRRRPARTPDAVLALFDDAGGLGRADRRGRRSWNA